MIEGWIFTWFKCLRQAKVNEPNSIPFAVCIGCEHDVGGRNIKVGDVGAVVKLEQCLQDRSQRLITAGVSCADREQLN